MLIWVCTAAAQTPTAPAILVVGDSLSAAYGMSVGSGWVALLGRRLAEQGYEYRVVNASASGETTGGALARLPRALELHQPAIVILELGGNDGLRGLPIQQIRSNLGDIIEHARTSGATVLLAGMRIPPNYGPVYTEAFYGIYGDLAASFDLPLVPFFLEGVALDAGLMQDDGIHPNSIAQERLLENVWPALEPLLERAEDPERRSQP